MNTSAAEKSGAKYASKNQVRAGARTAVSVPIHLI